MIAEEVTKVQADPLRAKKLNVLAALEVERFRKTALDMSQVSAVFHAPMQHAPCTMHHTPCAMHHAPCTMHHAPCTMHPAQP